MKFRRERDLRFPMLFLGFLLFLPAACRTGSVGGASSAAGGKKVLTCASCHAVEYGLWMYGGHRPVPCRRCHGQARAGTWEGGCTRSPVDPALNAGLCLSCHGGVGGGPTRVGDLEAHLRKIAEKHRVAVDRKRIGDRCIFCHDPHSLE